MRYLAGNLLSSLLALCVTTSVSEAQTSVPATTSIARISGGDAKLVRARRATAAIVIDGRTDDAAWSHAELATSFVQQRPTPGAPESERTEARVLFDATALYVSMRMFDSHPDSLLAPLGRRDTEAYGDWAHVIVDSYHDRRTGFHFAVNPAGTRRDAMISNDAEWMEDPSWDAVWDVATSRDSSGWTAEFRIPLTQLRFDRCEPGSRSAIALNRDSASVSRADADCVWGIQFMRDLARRNERSLWAPIAPDQGGYVSRFGTLAGVDGIRAPRRLELVPYTLARATQAPLDRANPFYERTAFAGALGADLGIGITPRLSLTATINPDFGQVEADPSEVNLTGSETFFRERRPFFVEGGDIFTFTLEDGMEVAEQLFYSRRIGRTPQASDPDGAVAVDRPTSTSIIGAAKLSGKAGPWTLGIVDAVTGAERGKYSLDDRAASSFIAEPRTNYAFARVFREGTAGRNSVGAVATAVHRDLDASTAGSFRASALAAGLDGRLRTRDRNYTVTANILGSFVRGSTAAIAETQRSSVHLLQRPELDEPLDTTRSSLAGLSAEVRALKQGGRWRWGTDARVVTSGFEVNDLGFQLRSNLTSLYGWLGYVHFEPGRLVRRWEIWSNHWGRWTFDGKREQLAANLFTIVNFQNNWMLMNAVRRSFSQQSPTLLRGGPAMWVPPNVGWWTRLVSDPRHIVSGELLTQGSIDDMGGGRVISASPIVTARPSSRAELSLQPSVTRVVNPTQYVETATGGGDTTYVVGALRQTTTALTARLNLTFTPQLSVQLYAQPFLSAGRYRGLGEVTNAGAREAARRVTVFDASAVARAADDALRIDRGPGRSTLELDDPDFTVRELKSNAVLRWEYRPGSALFLVWAQARDNDAQARDFSVSRQARDLWRTPGTNVLLIKASYWLSR